MHHEGHDQSRMPMRTTANPNQEVVHVSYPASPVHSSIAIGPFEEPVTVEQTRTKAYTTTVSLSGSRQRVARKAPRRGGITQEQQEI